MSHQTITMTVTRLRSIAYIDADGLMMVDNEDVGIEVEVSGEVCAADPDVGIMGAYAEDICAVDCGTGLNVYLDADEEEIAQEKLSEGAYDDGPDYDPDDTYYEREEGDDV